MTNLPINRRIGDIVRTHGMSKTKFYKKWKEMKFRCYNAKATSFRNYGARGIGVCKDWHCFENFRRDMLESYIGHLSIHGQKDTTLERIDNDQDYSLKNCRWATVREQVSNRRPYKVPNRKSKYNYSLNGLSMGLTQWAKRLGVKRSALQSRIRRGISIERALSPYFYNKTA